MIPDFTKYSLMLVKDGKEVFSSDYSGLRPLMMCVDECKQLRNCTLYDKVIGVAAARIIIFSGIISEVIAGVASERAIDLLKEKKIKIHPILTVKNIMRQDGADICPREKKALNMTNKDFFEEMKKIYS